MAAGLHDILVIYIEDPVCSADGGEAVGDDERGTSFQQCLDACLYHQFCLGVDA